MKTTLIKNQDIKREWHEFDASTMPLGRIASRAAQLLRGKNKVEFSTHQDMGDHVVIKNAAKLKVTGNKMDQKQYHRYSGYPGGLYTQTLRQKMARSPEEVICLAIRRMLPDNRLRKQMLRRLHVVDGDAHNFPIKKED